MTATSLWLVLVLHLDLLFVARSIPSDGVCGRWDRGHLVSKTARTSMVAVTGPCHMLHRRDVLAFVTTTPTATPSRSSRIPSQQRVLLHGLWSNRKDPLPPLCAGATSHTRPKDQKEEPDMTTEVDAPKPVVGGRRRRRPLRFGSTAAPHSSQDVSQSVASKPANWIPPGQDPTLMAHSSYSDLALVDHDDMSIDSVVKKEERNEQEKSSHNIGVGTLSPATLSALNDVCGVNQMTWVQSSTFGGARQGWSLWIRSKTGTGKTLAVLVPLIERLLGDPQSTLIVLAPTRELVQQIETTAQDLLTFHRSASLLSSSVQALHGGSTLPRSVMRHFNQSPHHQASQNNNYQMPRIWIATPGRLVDLLYGPQTQQKQRHWRPRLFSSSSVMLWLDEVDVLCNSSLGPQLERILQAMPRKRQTVCTCATQLPNNNTAAGNERDDEHKKTAKTSRVDHIESKRVGPHRVGPFDGLSLSQIVGEPIVGMETVDCIDKARSSIKNSKTTSQVNRNTKSSLVNQNVDEFCYVLPGMKDYVSALVSLLKQEICQQEQEQQIAKIVVFFPAAKLVDCMAHLVNRHVEEEQPHPHSCFVIHTIHSRMSQGKRQRASLGFREGASRTLHPNPRARDHHVLFTSDVSARGMDYPNVTLVIQYGLPPNRDSYLHRLGRTARAGQFGKGLLVALPWEVPHRQSDTQTSKTHHHRRKQTWNLGMTEWKISPPSVQQQQDLVYLKNAHHVELAEGAYKAFVAYYIGQAYSRQTILDAAQEWADSVGMRELPELPSALQHEKKKKSRKV